MAGKEREENFAKVIEFPKEVRVYGQISQVYFEGKDKFTTLIVEQNKTPTSSSQSKKKKKKTLKEPVLIVPIKQKNSEVHFVKVPLQKLSKVPKAEKLGESSCPKVNLQDGPPKTEKIAEYRTNLKEIWKRESFDKIRNDFDTCFVFQQSDPFQKDVFSKPNLPIADLFRFQEKPKFENSKEGASTVETSKGETNKGETNKGETNKGETNKGETNKGETNKGETNKGEANKGETNKGETNKDETNKGETNKGETNKVETSKIRKQESKSEMEEPQPSSVEKPSVREAETNTDENGRLMKFLISQNKRKRISN